MPPTDPNGFDDSPTALRRELTELFTKRIRGELSSDGADRLEALVVSDDRACELYVRVGFETAILARYAGQWRSWHRGDFDQLLAPAQADTDDTHIGAGPGFEVDVPRKSLLASLWTISPSSPTSWRISTRSLALIGTAAAVAVVCWLALGAWTFPAWRVDRPLAENEAPQGTLGSSEPAASLVAEQDCRWRAAAGQAPMIGTKLIGGTTLELEAGRVALQFADGAHVQLEGPARFTVEASGRGSLDRGKLVARVPKQAIGFAVSTPRANIVDRGTEFGVEVGKDGDTAVQVFQGVVELSSTALKNSKSDPPPQFLAQRINAGEAVRIRPVAVTPSTTSELIKLRPEQIAAWQSLRQPIRSGPAAKFRLVSGGKPVTASSTFHDLPYQFSALAVTDGRLADSGDTEDFSYWIAEVGRDNVEFTVDLQAEHTLAEIRLRNTHNGHWQNCGTKEFRLSVSRDGQQFTPVGSGTLASTIHVDTTPTERYPVSPAQRARYVKFEALSRYGEACGLNEIMVFAESDKPPASKR